jgi:hypothetical protein
MEPGGNGFKSSLNTLLPRLSLISLFFLFPLLRGYLTFDCVLNESSRAPGLYFSFFLQRARERVLDFELRIWCTYLNTRMELYERFYKQLSCATRFNVLILTFVRGC